MHLEDENARSDDEVLPEVRRAHRSPKWFYGVFAALLAVFILPMVAVCVIAFALPAVYDGTFVGVLGDKYERLETVDEPKIVVVGGSSVAFGLDSAAMEEELGMKVVNFGLYANLGTKLMMELSKVNINEGDIIVLAPELNSQTLSLYFNAETALQAMDGNWRMLCHLEGDDLEACIGALWGFSAEKLDYLRGHELPTNSGAYEKRWFNEYGDNIYDREYNETVTTAKSISLDMRVKPGDGVTSEYEEFISYVNDYTSYCKKRGAAVYFSFAPMNEAAMADSCTDDDIYVFYRNLCRYLDCKVISNINDYIMDEGYFFDSEFHLNNSGATVRTVRLIDDIKRELGDTSLTVSVTELPAPPGFKPIDVSGETEVNRYFTLELVERSGTRMWSVKGLNELGMAQTTLSIPDSVVSDADGVSYPVAIIESGALKGSALETLYLGENIAAIDPGAFSGAKRLTGIYVPLSKQPGDISVPNDMNEAGLAVDKESSSLCIYVNEKYRVEYVSDYFWGDYSSYLRGYAE